MPKANLTPPSLLFQTKSMLSPFLFLRESKPVGLEYCLQNATREVPARQPQHRQAPRAVPAHPLPFTCLLPAQAQGGEQKQL